MRIGNSGASNGSNRGSSGARWGSGQSILDGTEPWTTGRHHLSFDDVAGSPSERTTARRRVFARLAPPGNVDVSLSSSSSNNSDEDDTGAGDSRYFDAQVILLPPTPPRRRTVESDTVEGHIHHQGSLDDITESDDPPGAEHVRQVLERFGHLRRQRLLREQQLRMITTRGRNRTEPEVRRLSMAAPEADWTYTQGIMSTPDVTAATTTPAPASTTSADHIHAPLTGATASDAFHAPLPQHFPSNDVDSYWYNQPDAEDGNTT
ncbi:hypothetical protein LPJ73_008045, partial [Coemansia sp. RSA 2703]